MRYPAKGTGHQQGLALIENNLSAERPIGTEKRRSDH